MPRSSDLKPIPSPGLLVIGAGLPRTSTSSLQTALQKLGFGPCYHTITDLLPRTRNHGPLWLRAMHTEDKAVRQKLLAQIVSGYVAIVDGPGCFFVEDWIEMYPDAKVVLGLRASPQAWLDSVNGSIGKVFGRGALYYLTYFVPEMHFGFAMNNLWDERSIHRYGVGVRSSEYYVAHNEHIRNVVPRERLLEFEAKEGWEPLCAFLGREVPREEYPHRNDSKAANLLIISFLVNGVGIWIAVAVGGWGLVWGARRLLGI